MTKPPLDDRNAEGADDAPSAATSTGGNDPFGFSGWMKDGTPPPLHPLMRHPTASVAAAAAMGFGMASHFAGFMMGAMQGFVEATQRPAKAEEAEPEHPAAETVPPAETPVEPAPADANEAAPVDELAETVVADMAIAAEAPGPDAAPLKAPRSARPRTTVVTLPEDVVAAIQDVPAQKVARPRRTKAADDLKRISGIGPKLEQVLNGMGITRYAQIAGWDEAETARFDEALGVGGRIARDRWSAQAKTLMKG